jgi:hypothetical protein
MRRWTASRPRRRDCGCLEVRCKWLDPQYLGIWSVQITKSGCLFLAVHIDIDIKYSVLHISST